MNSIVPFDRSGVVAVARSWEGVPWKSVGDTRAGCNCLGFLVGVAREIGLSDLCDRFRPFQGFASPPQRLALLDALRRELIQVRRPRAGDVLLFRSGGQLTHVGLKVADGYLMHVSKETGAVREVRMTFRPVKSFQLPGVQ